MNTIRRTRLHQRVLRVMTFLRIFKRILENALLVPQLTHTRMISTQRIHLLPMVIHTLNIALLKIHLLELTLLFRDNELGAVPVTQAFLNRSRCGLIRQVLNPLPPLSALVENQ